MNTRAPSVQTPLVGRPGAAVHWVHAALLLGLVLGSWAVFDELPDRIPRHFDLDGTPDGWSDRTPAAWMTVPLIALAVSAVMYGAAWIIGRYPDTMNIPDRKRFLALPADARARVVRWVQEAVLWLGVLVDGLFLAMQAGTYRVAVGLDERLAWWARGMIVVVIVGSSLGGVVMLVRLSSLIRRLSEQSPPTEPSPLSSS